MEEWYRFPVNAFDHWSQSNHSDQELSTFCNDPLTSNTIFKHRMYNPYNSLDSKSFLLFIQHSNKFGLSKEPSHVHHLSVGVETDLLFIYPFGNCWFRNVIFSRRQRARINKVTIKNQPTFGLDCVRPSSHLRWFLRWRSCTPCSKTLLQLSTSFAEQC